MATTTCYPFPLQGGQATSFDGTVTSAASGSWPPSGGSGLSGVVTGPTYSTGQTKKALSGGQYQIYIWAAKFDTSGIPSTATITSASLLIGIDAIQLIDRTFYGEYYTFTNANTLAQTDWTNTFSYSASPPSTAFAAVSPGGTGATPITLSSPNTYINKGAGAATAIRAGLFANGTAAPGNDAYIQISTSYGSYSPRLEVTYTMPTTTLGNFFPFFS